jgi:predicted Kef-type K+ transport protein
MDHTAGPILEIGLVLLGAVGAGWLARRGGLPAIVGYLALGILVSPFTPGYVADHDQLQLLADVGVVLLLFEVGIEVGLGQIGEFSFVLGSAAVAAEAITHDTYVALVAAVAVSIALSTVLARVVGRGAAELDTAASPAR